MSTGRLVQATPARPSRGLAALAGGAALAALPLGPAPAPAAPAPGAALVVQEAFVVGSADWYRSASELDPVEVAFARGSWTPPQEGDVLRHRDGESRWHRVVADSAGWIVADELLHGHAYAAVESDEDRIVLLESFGSRVVRVNGELRAGNPYGYKDEWEAWEPRFDFSRLPVRLEAGRNDLLFTGSRAGRIKARLVPPPADVFLEPRDTTLPDLVVSEPIEAPGAVLVVNATDDWMGGLALEAGLPEGASRLSAIVDLPPRGVRKAAFRIEGPPPSAPGELALTLRIRRGAQVLDERTIPLAVRGALDNRRCTFISDVDGSVQFYGVLPARPRPGGPRPALLLSLHGAAVDAFNQSGSYAPKSWAHVVAPTNRRPFGYNWEDWGRLDALEVLDVATRRLDVDPDRVYLTGHSMGGHGTWHLGVLFPDRFAALGPSAGWLSFWSYRPDRAIEPRDDVERLLMRGTSPSRTLELAENLADVGVYVLHGAADDNVPAEQARTMVARLEEFHRDFVYHEQPGAGHWWDVDEGPGTDCVDWAPMLDFFARHARSGPDRTRHVRFLTPGPGVTASCGWARVEAQRRSLEPSRIDLRVDPVARRFAGTTENVARLALDATVLDGTGPVSLELDGTVLDVEPGAAGTPDAPEGGFLTLRHVGDLWTAGPPEPPGSKGPHRPGAFKDVFRRHVVLVVGTAGTPEENAGALAKARYDAEQFWYDGNGTLDVVPDTRFDPAADPDRNVVLYGNASTNRAWKALLGESPVQVARGVLRAGRRSWRGDDLGALLVRPRPGSDVACVAAVAGTGLPGMRACDLRPYLAPGFAFPDLTVFRVGTPEAPGRAILAAYFGNDWRWETAEVAEATPPDR